MTCDYEKLFAQYQKLLSTQEAKGEGMTTLLDFRSQVQLQKQVVRHLLMSAFLCNAKLPPPSAINPIQSIMEGRANQVSVEVF